MKKAIQTTREDHRIAWLAALAISIHVIEGSLPSPLPGIKPGLANIITIAVLIQYGWSAAAWVAALRVLVGSLIIGTFLTPTFILSLSGALSALFVLKCAETVSRRIPNWRLGPIGYSLLAAWFHMVGQFGIALIFFIPHMAILKLLPIFMVFSLVFGIVSGVIVRTMLNTVLPCKEAGL